MVATDVRRDGELETRYAEKFGYCPSCGQLLAVCGWCGHEVSKHAAFAGACQEPKCDCPAVEEVDVREIETFWAETAPQTFWEPAERTMFCELCGGKED